MSRYVTSFTEEEDRIIREMAGDKYSATDVAKELRRTRNSILGRAWRAGVKFNSRATGRRTGTPSLAKVTWGVASYDTRG